MPDVIVRDITIGNERPLVLISGPCQIESASHAGNVKVAVDVLRSVFQKTLQQITPEWARGRAEAVRELGCECDETGAFGLRERKDGRADRTHVLRPLLNLLSGDSGRRAHRAWRGKGTGKSRERGSLERPLRRQARLRQP